MSISVQVISGPLPHVAAIETPGAGAVIVFDGVVRPMEGSGPISALNYEVYSPMAERTLGALAKEILQQHDLLAMDVWHSSGHVAVGEVSFRLRVASTHRKEAIAAMDEFIDRLKQDVPIWKHPVPATMEVR